MSSTSAPIHPANLPIPVDLFVSKKHPALPRGVLGFADSSGKIIFRVNRQSSKSSSDDKIVLLDSAGNPLFSIYRHQDGSWQGFKGDGDEKDLIFKVQRILNKFTRTELEVFLVAENQGESTCDFKFKGCHFQRSCTIYKGDSIVAQTSLMHKLRQIYVRRNKFRLTMFPGSEDPALIVALVVIFLVNGPKKFQFLDKLPLSI
ncbi:protein LURP-one-related 7 [Durio zibethinus]|uniref:Protein LURP-one-related 7 n=1 Tax=Durio zibethinus TaxID=66656 RepID=A0A6P5XP62_DURZI|nr:protein LURP-one-related 7 [Durio zibethinus]